MYTRLETGIELSFPEKEESVEKEDRSLRIGRAEGRVLTLYEAAERLKTSYTTVYRLVMDGELPAFRIRNSWRTSDVICDEYVNKMLRENASTCQSIEIE